MTEDMGPEHVERLNTIEKLEQEGFEGPDACLMISLFEYGLAWRETDEGILFIYGIKHGMSGDYTRFDRCTLAKDTDPKEEWSWANWDDLCNFTGDGTAYPEDYPLTQVVSDLLNYYGYENVFGASYWEGFAIEGDDQHEED